MAALVHLPSIYYYKNPSNFIEKEFTKVYSLLRAPYNIKYTIERKIPRFLLKTVLLVINNVCES